MEWRTAGGCACKCGMPLSYHQEEPAYYGAERFGEFQSVAERERGCKEFRYDPNPEPKEKKFRFVEKGEDK